MLKRILSWRWGAKRVPMRALRQRDEQHTDQSDRFRAHDSGMVTTEFAIVIPIAVGTILALIGLMFAATGVYSADMAAKEAARALAIGMDNSEVSEIVHDIAGESASFTSAVDGEFIDVTVTVPPHVPFNVFGLDFESNYRIVAEPGVVR